MFVLSPPLRASSRRGSARGCRWASGPIVGGIGLLLLMRVDADPNYLTEVLPAMLVFGLGLSTTVAPLTATALNSVEERHVGVASGINNGGLAGRRACSRSPSSGAVDLPASSPRRSTTASAGQQLSAEAHAAVETREGASRSPPATRRA